MKLLTFSILFLGAFFSSCSHTRSIQENREGISDAKSEANKEVVEEGYYVKRNKAQGKDLEIMGLDPNSKYTLALLGNGNQSLTFIGLLKEFERRKIKLVGLSGRGVGALVAALYAKYGKASRVEWILYKYLDKYFPYSKDFEGAYFDSVRKIIRREFKGLDFDKTKIELKIGSSLEPYQYLSNEFEKRVELDTFDYDESVCVYESSLFQEEINICFYPKQIFL